VCVGVCLTLVVNVRVLRVVARQNQYILYNVDFGAVTDMQIYVNLYNGVWVLVCVCGCMCLCVGVQPVPAEGHCISVSQVRNKRANKILDPAP